MSADNVLGWEIVFKISHFPSKLRFSAKYSFFEESLSRGHYQPTYQPPGGGGGGGGYLLNRRAYKFRRAHNVLHQVYAKMSQKNARVALSSSTRMSPYRETDAHFRA